MRWPCGSTLKYIITNKNGSYRTRFLRSVLFCRTGAMRWPCGSTLKYIITNKNGSYRTRFLRSVLFCRTGAMRWPCGSTLKYIITNKKTGGGLYRTRFLRCRSGGHFCDRFSQQSLAIFCRTGAMRWPCGSTLKIYYYTSKNGSYRTSFLRSGHRIFRFSVV